MSRLGDGTRLDHCPSRPPSERLPVKARARSILPMIAFRDAACITHNPLNGTVFHGREGPARFAGRVSAVWNHSPARAAAPGTGLRRWLTWPGRLADVDSPRPRALDSRLSQPTDLESLSPPRWEQVEGQCRDDPEPPERAARSIDPARFGSPEPRRPERQVRSGHSQPGSLSHREGGSDG